MIEKARYSLPPTYELAQNLQNKQQNIIYNNPNYRKQFIQEIPENKIFKQQNTPINYRLPKIHNNFMNNNPYNSDDTNITHLDLIEALDFKKLKKNNYIMQDEISSIYSRRSSRSKNEIKNEESQVDVIFSKMNI